MSGINPMLDSYTNAPVNSAKSASKVKKTEDKTVDKTAEEAAAKTTEKKTDKFERTERSSANTYTKSVTTQYVGKSALQIKNEGMKDVVAAMLGQQASKTAGKKGIAEFDLKSVMKSYGLDYIESDGSEDFWGAEKTANRILDFAKSLAGNDKEAFEKVKNAFEKGFGECEGIWGGKLPGVCYDTLSKVREGFDEWEKEFDTQSAAAAQ